MSKKEAYPVETEAAEDVRLVQLAGVAVGGLREVFKRGLNRVSEQIRPTINLENLLPGENPEPLRVHIAPPDVDALRRQGY